MKINWQHGAPPPELEGPWLEDALRAFCAGLGLPAGHLEVLLADNATLRRLNQTHRGRDTPTDVLSWSYLPEGWERLPAPMEEEDQEVEADMPLGELALSLEQAAAQAAENGWDLRTELLRLLAHGCAHVAGHDHQTPQEDARMRAVEEGLLARVGLHGLYPVG